MNEWADAVNSPLGFAAFGLLLLFLYLKGAKNAWLKGVFLGAALIAFGIGTYLAIRGVDNEPVAVQQLQPPPPAVDPSVQQVTSGPCSPAVAGSSNVTISCEENTAQEPPK